MIEKPRLKARIELFSLNVGMRQCLVAEDVFSTETCNSVCTVRNVLSSCLVVQQSGKQQYSADASRPVREAHQTHVRGNEAAS